MLHRLLVECHCILDDPDATPAMKTIAGSAVLSAFEENLYVPLDLTRSTWRWLRCATQTHLNVDAFSSVNDDVIRREAVAMLTDPHSGANEWRLAIHLLSGSGHAQHVEDATLMALVEAAATGGRALDLAGLIVAVHKARGVADRMLLAIRDRWTRGSIGMKEAAVTVASELPVPDVAWVKRVLADSEPDVRACLAYQLERDGRSQEGLVGVLEEHLRVESSPDVRAAVQRALAALEDVENDHDRRRRRRKRLLEEAHPGPDELTASLP